MGKKRKITGLAILIIALTLSISCTNPIRSMFFDIPEPLWGHYENEIETLTIANDNILVNGMPFEDFILSSAGGYGEITGFYQESVSDTRYSFTAELTISVNNQSMSVPISISAALNGNELIVNMTMSGKTSQSIYRKI